MLKILRSIYQEDSVFSFRPTTMKLIETASDDQSSARDLAQIIEKDPSLSIRLLKLANSAWYGRRQQVFSISQAVVLIGFVRLRTMAISLSLTDTFPIGKVDGLDYHRFWQISLYRALIAQALAHLTKYPQPEEAFIAGLILEIGLLRLLSISSKKTKTSFPGMEASLENLLDWEQKTLGIHHRKVAEIMLERWRFSENLLECQRLYGRQALESNAPILCQISEFSRMAAESFFEENGDFYFIYNEANRLFNLQEVETKQILSESFTRVEETAELLGIQVDSQKHIMERGTNRFFSSQLSADTTVGKYVISEIIGRGGWGIVYKGIHTGLNIPVAIKMLKYDLARDPDFLEQFQSEAKIMAYLNHESIVRVYDIEKHYKTIFIIMEYLKGVSLKYILKKQRLPLSKVLNNLLQVCAGLAYAHERGIVHRDIHPGNVFVQPNDRVKIVDFGLACLPGVEEGPLEGSMFYMSPEQIEGKFVDERSDIYSLGITAYEMITGRKPFPGEDIHKLIDFHLYKDVPDPRTFIPDLPDELHNFIMRATQKDTVQRYQNISQIINDLKSLAKKVGVKLNCDTY
ncbi:MAG: HDOD domain-containing protein [Thermodesulfobacteriota bacterium]|nr:HDOD domain-containing protein [Thermodesulfobacteriota bacterium]